MIELAINELSYIDAQANNGNEAKSLYDAFFGVCRNIAKDYKTKVVLRYSEAANIRNTAFYPTYPFEQWLNSLPSDEISLILGMLTKMPLIKYPYYKVYGIEGHGISYAYENDSLLLSLKSHSRWQVNKLIVSKEYLNKETSEIETETKEVCNCFQELCVQIHKKCIKTRLLDKEADALKEITSGEILWRERKRFFPDLLFCNSVEDEIKYLAGNAIVSLRNQLREFEDYFCKWKTGDFDIDAISGKPRLESNSRINKLGKRLKITCPDGKVRLFTYHCNWWEWGYRMHFYPDSISRKCIIGYIGKKIV